MNLKTRLEWLLWLLMKWEDRMQKEGSTLPLTNPEQLIVRKLIFALLKEYVDREVHE